MMNRRLLILFFPFVLALVLFLTVVIPATTAAGPDGVEEVNVTWPVNAAALNLNDNLYSAARLTGQNQSVFGPACNTALGDPFSPISSTFRPPNHYTNPAFPAQYFTYRYRINIPDNYETANNTSIIRVELFDPDTYNLSPGLVEIDTTFYTISHTQPYGPPATISKQCTGADQQRKEACVLTTDEPETYNPYWFVRMDEIRQNTGSSCVSPSAYNQGHPTQTAFQLYYYRTVSNTIETQQLGDYYGRPDNAHDTDLRWVSPGGGLSYDQSVNVPAHVGSFEVNLNNLSNMVIDPATGTRTLYLDVTAFSGASENGFDVWAGPPGYTGPANPGNACQGGVPSKVNQRNIHITNCGSAAHSSGGVSIVALDYLPTNYNSTNAITRKLVYIGPEYAGQTVHVSLFDSDSGARAPVLFYFDTLGFKLQVPPPNPPANPVNASLTDWYLAFAVNNTTTADPDLQPGGSRNCYPGTCNNTWITPTYRIQVPMLDPDLCINGAPVYYCTPFYGGWLTVRYLPGYHDTAAWQVELPEPPLVDTTVTCPGVFPVTMPDSVRSVTANDYLVAWNTPSNMRYPSTLPAYSSFLAHTPDVSLDEAEPGDIFLFVGEGRQIDNYSFLLWNTDYTCQGCNQGHIRLRDSLTWPGNVLNPSLGFHEIGDWNDTRLQVGDRVAFSEAEGSATTSQMSGHIDRGRTIQMMAWSETGTLIGGGPGGSDVSYFRASQFVNFRILGYKFVSTATARWILAEFVGRDTHCGQPGPDIGFAGSSYSVGEASEVVALTVELGYALANTVTVSYTTGNGTATAGQDYAAATGLLTFPPGDTQTTFLIPIHDDLFLEGDETFTVTLSSPVNGVITNTNPVTVTIVDDEVAAQINLSVTSITPNENNNDWINVYLDSLVPYTVTVDFATSDGTATQGQDYIPISYTIMFPPWSGGSEFISMPILDDTLLEGPETFFIALANPMPPGVTISGTNPITITIMDNEQPAQIGFAAATVTAPENSGSAQVVIQQNQAHTSPLQVNVTTSDVTATGGTDYTVTSDVINFNGAAAYTLTIPILDDSLAEGHELFWVTLSDPVNGTIISPNPMAVLILDNECAFSPATGPGRIESEDFDCGGEGVAYHDSTPGNNGSSSYRFGDDVDVWSSAAASQGHYIGSTAVGEWLVYSVVITETGRYDVGLAAATTTSAQVRIVVDGVDVSGVLNLPGTGGGENFVEVAAASGIYLTAGTHQIHVFIITGGANLDYLVLSPTPEPPRIYLPLMLKPTGGG